MFNYQFAQEVKLQRVIEFRKRNFWSSQIDVDTLNEKIAELNKDGWTVKSITLSNAFFGAVISYTLLVELAE